MRSLYRATLALIMGIVPMKAMADIAIEPYVAIRSTKSVSPDKKDKTLENEKIRQRQEVGIRTRLKIFSLFSLQVSVGQNKLTTTDKVADAKDEYDEIDYKSDLNMSTDDGTKDIKVVETQNNAQFSTIINPSFSIFILHARVGITATQRIVEAEETGKEKTKITKGPTFKPHSGFGGGIRIGPSMYFLAEYSFFHYKFPEIEPFERVVSISYGLSI